MSVMSAGKKPKALVRPLRTGKSRAGLRPGRFRAGEPGTAASRSEKRNVPGVSAPGQPDSMVSARPRAARKPLAPPRLWVVPDAPGTAAPEPGIPESVISGPVSSGPTAPGPRKPGDGPVRHPLETGSAPMVPRPRVAPDEQIPGRPGIPPAAPRRPQHGGPDLPPGLTRPGRQDRSGPGQPEYWRGRPGAGRLGVGQPNQAPRYPRRTGEPVAPTRARVARVASAPSRMPAGRARRTRLTRRGRRLAWASAVLLLLAVIIPVLLAVASGAQASNHEVPPSAVRAAMRQVVVKPGQSLWSIALSAEPKADPRVVIQQIVEFNALGSQVVVPGESLWVPKG